MPDTIELIAPGNPLTAHARLPASKSLSNRLLLLEALSEGLIRAQGHSDAEDTVRLQQIVQHHPADADAGAGGTTIRFALAYLSTREGYEGTLRGSERLHQRPIRPLVDALRELGADITYLEKEGFPPLAVRGKKLNGGTISLTGEVSSQFLSAVLLIAPALRSGLEVRTGGKILSKPYLDMTLALLRKAGFTVEENEGRIRFGGGRWLAQEIEVEKDWSSASYWYSLVALTGKSQVVLPGLTHDSLQGDAMTARIYHLLGVDSEAVPGGLALHRTSPLARFMGYDFRSQPDLAQTVAVTVAGLKTEAHFSGLESLRVKETDRIAALRRELAKINVFTDEPAEGELRIDAREADLGRLLIVDTYDDHRMALAFAPLVMKVFRLAIRDPEVVRKSYPRFWEELRKAGVGVKEWTG